MADLSINMLPASDSLDDDSLLPVYQYNRAHKIRGQLIKQFAQASVEEYVSAARAAAEQAEQAAKDAQAAADLVAYASERAEEAAQAALAAQNAQAAAEAARIAAEAAASLAAEQAVADAENLLQGYLTDAENAKNDAQTAAESAAKDVEAKLQEYVSDAEQARDDAETAAKTAAAETAAAIESDMQGYLLGAEAAQQAAEHARDEAKAIAGGDFVSVTDIVDNLITNASNKPLSAAQGVVLRGLIDKLQSFVDDAALCQPDWNQNDETAKDYVKNRFGGYYEKVYDALLEETELNFSHELVNLEDCDYAYTAYLDESTVVSLWEGGTVRVVFDGVTYEKTYESYGFAPDDSVPFGIFADIIDLGKAFIYTLSDEDSHTVEISKIESTAVPVPEEFLPHSVKVQPDWSVNDETDPAYVKNRTHYSETTYIEEFNGEVQIPSYDVAVYHGCRIDTIMLQNETSYRVVFDGIEYILEATATTDGAFTTFGGLQLGNLNDYPFCIVSGMNTADYDEFRKIETTEDYNGTYSLVIERLGEVVVPLNEKYLPDTLVTKDYLDEKRPFGYYVKEEVWEPYAENVVVPGFTDEDGDGVFVSTNLVVDFSDAFSSDGVRHKFVVDGVEYEGEHEYTVDEGGTMYNTFTSYDGELVVSYDMWGEHTRFEFKGPGESHVLSAYYPYTANVPVTVPEEFLPAAEPVADVTEAPTADDFNALLNSLRNAGYLASE